MVVKITPSPNLITVILSTISSPSLSYPLSSRFRTYLFHKSSSPEALLLLPALPSCTITRTVSSELPGFLLRPRERWRSIVMSASVCVCLSVSLSVCPRAYLLNNMRDLYKIFVHVSYGRGSVLLRQGDECQGGGQFWGFSSPLTMHCTHSIWDPYKNG